MKSITATERGSVWAKGCSDGEGDDEDRAGDGDGADDQEEVAAADVAPPLLVEAEGGEDDELADDDEADRLGEEHLVAVRHAPRVEEAQPEGQVEGQRDERRVGKHLEDPVAVDGMVQPAAWDAGEFRALNALGSRDLSRCCTHSSTPTSPARSSTSASTSSTTPGWPGSSC